MVLFEFLNVFKFRKHCSFCHKFLVVFPIYKYYSLAVVCSYSYLFDFISLLSLLFSSFIVLKEFFYFMRFRSGIDRQLFAKVVIAI